MKKFIVLAAFLMAGCIQVRCVAPLGKSIRSPADGQFDKSEVTRLRKLIKNKSKVTNSGEGYKALISYANDMHVFIKNYVYKDWKGVKGISLYIAKDKYSFYKAWKHCIGFRDQKMGPKTIGFFCPYTDELNLLSDTMAKMIEVYDHEEGHYQNDLGGDAIEFAAEYNSRWKAFVRFAMNTDVGYMFADYINSDTPRNLPYRKIKDIGTYKAASLMFFFVANHYNGNLTKGAKFVFTNNEKTLLKFFYKKLNAYPKKETVRTIWQTEVLKLWNGVGVQNYIKYLRLRAKVYKKEKK